MDGWLVGWDGMGWGGTHGMRLQELTLFAHRDCYYDILAPCRLLAAGLRSETKMMQQALVE